VMVNCHGGNWSSWRCQMEPGGGSLVAKTGAWVNGEASSAFI
jgi:hypothetical protein